MANDNAARLTAGHGSVAVEYFDTGYSRSLAWHHRPAAARLLHDPSQPNGGFDAVVIGEYERAFARRPPSPTHHPPAADLRRRRMAPETDGPVNLNDPTHRAPIMLLGHQSEREVLRARVRTTTAMCTQARDQGRHPGGRPPYGYRLTDAGPHPNRDHARWGRRLHRLDPDPTTASDVRWIFAQRLAGPSTASIARPSTTAASPPSPPTTPSATVTAPAPVGRCGPSPRSWRIRATPVGRCGTGNARSPRNRARRQTHPPRTGPGVEPQGRLGDLQSAGAPGAGQ